VSRGLDEETSLALIHLRKELPRMPVPELIKTGHKRRLLNWLIHILKKDSKSMD